VNEEKIELFRALEVSEVESRGQHSQELYRSCSLAEA